MRDLEQDKHRIRAAIQAAGINEIVYISPNHYDGGYEVRVGTRDIFVEYPVLDAGEGNWVNALRD